MSPITKKLEEINESTKKLGGVPKISDVEDGNTQTPATPKITGTQSLRATITLMKRSKIHFKLVKKDTGDVFWNGVPIKPLN